MNSKGAIIGTTISTIVATVAIAIILLIFVFSSTLIKTFSSVDDGVQIDKKFDNSNRDYFDSFKELFENIREYYNSNNLLEEIEDE